MGKPTRDVSPIGAITLRASVTHVLRSLIKARATLNIQKLNVG
jgi:hypothetical protein